MKTPVLIPSPMQIEALASCALSGNQWAAQLLGSGSVCSPPRQRDLGRVPFALLQ